MIDVFFDKLEYCHTIDYAGRLELDPYSVSLTDILLQKLQIWEINDKDLKDIEYLFTCAPFGDDDDRKVNVGYVARRLADDWGFWYTATTNLVTRARARGRRAGALRGPADLGQGGRRPARGAHRGRAQDEGLGEAREEGHLEGLVQPRLLRLVSEGGKVR